MRAVVEVGQLGGLERRSSGLGSSLASSTNPPYDSRPMAGPICALEIDRVARSVTFAESPVASTRT